MKPINRIKQQLKVPTLLDCAIKAVAKHITLAEIQSLHNILDNSMLKKIAFWAFPNDESQVKEISQLTTIQRPFEWDLAEELVKEGMVKKITQVGFTVAANVQKKDGQDCKVTLTFEKQHVTSTSCSACADVVSCKHIIAVILQRIRHPNTVPIYAPLTETLSLLSRSQLQKLLQHAVHEDPRSVSVPVFQLIDRVSDTKSEVNIATAPDHTFGMFPVEKSILDLSLEKTKRELIADIKDTMKDGKTYTDSCDVFVKRGTFFYQKYFKRVVELITKNENEAAGTILISIAESFDQPNLSWSKAKRKLMLDTERMFSCFIACNKGKIKQDMIEAALAINKKMNCDAEFLDARPWSEMTSIRLLGIGNENMAKVHAMGASVYGPFYEPVVASQLPDIPLEPQQFSCKDIALSEIVYDEPLDLMLFRLECLVQQHVWTNDEKFLYLICVFGALILKKLIGLSDKLSILTFDEKLSAAMKTVNVKESEEDEICGPPPKKIKKAKTKNDKIVDKLKMKILKDQKYWNGVWPTEKRSFDGLTQAQLCYSMLYVCLKMWQTTVISKQQPDVQKTLAEATVRVFELSFFRYWLFRDLAKEILWWEKILNKILNYIRNFPMVDKFQDITERYCQAMLKSGLDYYNGYRPLSLIDLFFTLDCLSQSNKLKLTVEVLCCSEEPVHTYRHVEVGFGWERKKLNESVMKIHQAMLSHVFAVKIEFSDDERSNAARKVLSYLASVTDAKYVVTAYNIIQINVESIIGNEDKLIMLGFLLAYIRGYVAHPGKKDLKFDSSSVLETLLYLGKSPPEELVEYLIPKWNDICKYFNKEQVKSLKSMIRQAVQKIPSLITDMGPTLQKYFTSSFEHGHECCVFLEIFYPNEAKRNTILNKIVANGKTYTTSALLRIGKTEYKLQSATDPSITIFSKQVYRFLMMGLLRLTKKDSSKLGSGLSEEESKYLKWYFGMIAASLNTKIIKSQQYTSLMKKVKELLRKDVQLMLDFYQAMEVSSLGLKETKSQFGNELVTGFMQKFDIELKRCEHCVDVFMEMKLAIKECEKYVPNGVNEFGLSLVKCIRQKCNWKKK